MNQEELAVLVILSTCGGLTMLFLIVILKCCCVQSRHTQDFYQVPSTVGNFERAHRDPVEMIELQDMRNCEICSSRSSSDISEHCVEDQNSSPINVDDEIISNSFSDEVCEIRNILLNF